MRIILALGLALALPVSAHAQTQTFFLHNSDVPVAIPGGSTLTFLDALAPTEPTVATAEDQVVAQGATGVFSTFTAPAFGADTTLLPIASVLMHFSANQKMRGCAALTADLYKLDASGIPAPIGGASIPGYTIGQAKSDGAVAVDYGQRIEFPVTDTSVLTGESIAVAPSLTNQCNANRRVFFSYDSQYAAARVRFQCCFTTAAKCAEKKIKTVGDKANCSMKASSKAALKALPLDPVAVTKCSTRFLGYFTKVEAHGGCPTVGDGPSIEVVTDALTGTLDVALAPLDPMLPNRCQGSKLKYAGQTAKCLVSVQAKAASKGQFLEPDPLKAQRCRDKLTQYFTKVESKPGCDTVGDAPGIIGMLDTFANAIAAQLACPCPP